VTWNYRVIHTKNNLGEEYYGIHEVYYEDVTNKPYLRTADAVAAYGESLEDLRGSLERMLEALEKETLAPQDFPGDEK